LIHLFAARQQKQVLRIPPACVPISRVGEFARPLGEMQQHLIIDDLGFPRGVRVVVKSVRAFQQVPQFGYVMGRQVSAGVPFRWSQMPSNGPSSASGGKSPLGLPPANR
jgi:hypothetical protein